MRFQRILVSALVLASCRTPTHPDAAVGSVRIQTSLVTYATSDSIHVRIKNTGPHMVLFNECPTFVEKHNGSSWVVLNPRGWFEDAGCELILRILPVGSVYSYKLPPLAASTAGTYRLQLSEFWDGDGFTRGPELEASALRSNTFTIAQ